LFILRLNVVAVDADLARFIEQLLIAGIVPAQPRLSTIESAAGRRK
jgi:hypothetical protein